MPIFIVAYDVDTPYQGAVKRHLLANGFHDHILRDIGGYLRLPNTTLALESVSSSAALELFYALANAAGPGYNIVNRAIALNAAGAWGEGEVMP